MVGGAIGGLELIEQLGTGPSGDVWRARRESGREVVVYEHVAREPARVARLLTETRRAAEMRHEAVVRVLDCGVVDGRLWIVAEHWESNSLGTALRRGALPAAAVIRLVDDIGSALEAAHARRIVHGAVEPGFIRTDGARFKILGFGLYAGGEEEEQPGRFAERATYRAPEQRRTGVASPRADQYSLGCIAYEALTGELPGRGDVPSAASHPGAPRAVAAALRRALQDDPARRFPTVGALRAAVAETQSKDAEPLVAAHGR